MTRKLLLTISLCIAAGVNAQFYKSITKAPGFEDTFGYDPKAKNDFSVVLLNSNAPANIYLPNEKATFDYQIQNNTKERLQADGSIELIQFGARTQGDIWNPPFQKIEDIRKFPLKVDLEKKGWKNFSLDVAFPETFGGYALIVEFGEKGRTLVTTMARVRPNPLRKVHYPKQTFQPLDGPACARLGLRSIRYNIRFVLPDSNKKEEHDAEMHRMLTEMHENNVTVMAQMGTGGEGFPMGVQRPHLDENGVMKKGKADWSWLPEYDDEFEEYCYQLATTYGWPKGPITAFNLWNEPWESKSISGWQADIPRYRKIYKHMANAVLRAKKDAGVDILVGGCDSSTNAWDKLFADGSDEFLPIFDFVSIHYQGLRAPVLYPEWHNRKEGRVLIWDTESWVANSDERFGSIVAVSRASGYDRAMGVKESYVVENGDFRRRRENQTVFTDSGKEKREPLPHALAMAASVAAAQDFLGERDFKEILFKNGLPQVYVFEGENGNEEDGTVVVLGDLETLLNKTHTLFHSVRDLESVREIDQLMKSEADAVTLEKRMAESDPIEKGKITISGDMSQFRIYDFYGNRKETNAGSCTLPLNSNCWFLRGDGSDGSFKTLVDAIKQADIQGIQPMEIIAYDFDKRLEESPKLILRLTNVLNRPVSAKLSAQLENCDLKGPESVKLAPHETRTISYSVVSGKTPVDNRTLLKIRADAGNDGLAVHAENLRVNVIEKRTVTVDGKLDDWRGALPQIIETDEAAQRSFTEAAWLPFEKFEAGEAGGFAAGYLGWDEEYFYFAAKVADNTPHEGTYRMESRPDDEFFYPEVSWSRDKKEKYGWPEGVRNFSYRKKAHQPDGSNGGFDNIQIAFNAIPDKEDEWLTHLPGRMPRFIWYKCTDYEYALNVVAPEYGGGSEVWRLLVPGMSYKHFFPRQPKHPLEGAVKDAKLVTRYADGTRITEVAIPWSEIPHVKTCLDENKPVKFSFRVNHEKRGPTMELAMNRSVSRLNRAAFHATWKEHWANELSFTFSNKKTETETAGMD